MNIVEENDSVIAVKDEEAFVIPIVNGSVVQNKDVPDSVFEYVVENTEYDTVKDVGDINWPLHFTTSTHLEDSMYLSAISKIEEVCGEKTAERIFIEEMDNKVDKPDTELTSAWKLYEDGSVKLEFVKYDDVRFTPEEM